jgi:hypothetical protein
VLSNLGWDLTYLLNREVEHTTTYVLDADAQPQRGEYSPILHRIAINNNLLSAAALGVRIPEFVSKMLLG